MDLLAWALQHGKQHVVLAVSAVKGWGNPTPGGRDNYGNRRPREGSPAKIERCGGRSHGMFIRVSGGREYCESCGADVGPVRD